MRDNLEMVQADCVGVVPGSLSREDVLRRKVGCWASPLAWAGKAFALMVPQWDPPFTKGGNVSV